MNRKRIALLTMNPSEESQRSIMDGIFRQCEAYNYDVAVISPLVHITHYFKDYLRGELNIFNLINFDLFDGVIVTPIPMAEEQLDVLTKPLLQKLQENCKCPVVSLNMAFGNYPIVHSDQKIGMKVITKHLIEKHHCRKLMILTGPENFPISHERVAGVREALQDYHMILEDSDIRFGDFWYGSGEKLAQELLQNREQLPDAVICASDHMAIGLVNELTKNGIRVPEDIIVTGNGGTKEAAAYYPPLTTFTVDESGMGAAAVDALHHHINPGEPDAPYHVEHLSNLCVGCTCGCEEDIVAVRNKLFEGLYVATPYTKNEQENKQSWNNSLFDLIESYAIEQLLSTDSIQKAVEKMYDMSIFLRPYNKFYLCLNERWYDIEQNCSDSYANRMNMILYADQAYKNVGYSDHIFVGQKRERLFDRDRMLPAFYEDSRKSGEFCRRFYLEEEYCPQVYYFMPIHFGEETVGYAVLQNNIQSPVRISNVYHQFLRYICNALEMSRAKEYVRNLSEHDTMTGLLNRRGMERWVEKRLAEAAPDAKWFAIMIDMNNLKLINDSIGHDAGDEGIKAISRSAFAVTNEDEICVRAGGDEFYVIGIGDYSEDQASIRVAEFEKNLSARNKRISFDILVTAAVGHCVLPIASASLHEALDQADLAMYVDKRNKKHQRPPEA